MKRLWIALLILIGVAAVIALQPARNSRIDPVARQNEEAAVERAVAETIATPPPATPATSAAEDLAKDLMTDRAKAVPGVAAASADEAATAPRQRLADFKDGLDRTIKGATVSPGRFERGDDGALIADGRYQIRGAGTEDDPYTFSWELLISANDTFIPREGQLAIPQRVALLDGKRVRIEGFLIFPIVATTQDEVIVAMNQWDGCCIGVPPTAYDAIEAKLAKGISLQRRQHQIMFGAIEGTFRVDPYVMDQWLYGLYLLDDGTIKLDL